jgi:fructose-specific phosphotransferase system IIC component
MTRLSDVVKKVSDTGYIFWNINDDLGHAADQVMQSAPEVRMAYAYARRTAVAALFLQGLVSKDVVDRVAGIFMAVQQKTGHTIEFQEKAAAESTKFMQEYHYLIGGLFEKKLIQIAREYEVLPQRLDDPELFKAVMDTIYVEQEEARRS